MIKDTEGNEVGQAENDIMMEIDQEFTDQNDIRKQALHDFKDSYEMSKLALKKCNKLIKPNSKFLRAGEGHYVSMPDRKMSDLYSIVFNSQHQAHENHSMSYQ